MPNETLRTLLEHELHDLWSAEQQIIAALPEMISAAKSEELRRALQHHLERTRIHAERLDLIYKQCGIKPLQKTSSGVDGIIRAGRTMVSQQTDDDVRDAAIIDAAQHVEHYEIAGYGCARTFARQLDDDRSAELLQQTLDEEGDANKRLTSIAEAGINEAATAGAHRERAHALRLRYAKVDDLPSADQYRDVRVRNHTGDDLGRVDGFVLAESGRPYYLVVDSGGLFVGRRYIVPVGKAEWRRTDRAFAVDLDKDTLKRYPEFHPEAFIAMTDEEARRYEWRVLEAVDPQAARSATGSWRYDQFPVYREPDWFHATSREAGARGAGSATPPKSREVPVTSERETRERVRAQEISEEPIQRERVRGSDEDLK
jgi:ferritin-like metal-binding protein YciE